MVEFAAYLKGTTEKKQKNELKYHYHVMYSVYITAHETCPLTIRLPSIGCWDFHPLSQLLKFLDHMTVAFQRVTHGSSCLQDITYLGEDFPQFIHRFFLQRVFMIRCNKDTCLGTFLYCYPV